MIRIALAYVLTLSLGLAGISLAHARGENADMDKAIDMVICTGVGMVTFVIGPDGEPVESVHLCPDGAQMIAATFAIPMLVAPQTRMFAQLSPVSWMSWSGREELAPSARGPPV